MDNNLFYINFIPSEQQDAFINEIMVKTFDDINPVYVINKPVIERKGEYSYDDAFAVLMPNHKIIFINSGRKEDEFENFVEDFIEDIGYIAKKYDFLEIVGRPRQWREQFTISYSGDEFNSLSFSRCCAESELRFEEQRRKGEILISLVTGSINEAERLGRDIPQNILEQIKRKIILFDGAQTRFIFDEPPKKRIVIQGLAGTGKTELLLHKIKELYTSKEGYKIVFTCHNEILADSLRKRVPDFFNFMKVEEQIEWNSRLWVMRSWGSSRDCNSGVYSYICKYYGIPFERYEKNSVTFDSACKRALSRLEKIENFECCFDYVLIDESQDFSDSFFDLCEKVTSNCVYVAGDIFQDIFEDKQWSVIDPDFLLNKCYRTDPRTLMGAHAIGMGLFERKLRWLSDEEWEACGYIIEKENDIYSLRRKPLKRFEDTQNIDCLGIEIRQLSSIEPQNYLTEVLGIIRGIKEKYSTVEPDDIAIMFMENMNDNFGLASMLQMQIKEEFGWDTNVGYETKEKKRGAVFISNRNNVKGLEFPFVICIMQQQMGTNFKVRNSIYMMLTRSFISSFFIIPEILEYGKELIEGIDFVNQNGYMKVKCPSQEEAERLRNTIIGRNNLRKSQYDIIEDILDEFEVDRSRRKKAHNIVETISSDETDRDELRDIIMANMNFI